MKRVVNTATVFHYWANEVQSYARNGTDSVSFDGPTAYSYRMPIAKIVVNALGHKAYLVTSSTCSVTTAKHIGQLRRSIPVNAKVFPALIGLDRWGSVFNPTLNLTRMIEEIDELTQTAKRARTNKVWHIRRLISDTEKAKSFASFFALTEPIFSAEVIAACDSYEAVSERMETIRLAIKEKHDKRKEEQLAKLSQNLQLWKEGKLTTGSLDPFYNLKYRYMRIVGDNIETTGGAVVPIADVTKAMSNILYILNRWGKNGELEDYIPKHLIRFGYYSLTSITAAGIVTVGCHRFEREEILRIAELLKTI